MKTNIAVLASGSGSNLQSIINQAEKGKLPVNIQCVICDRADAYALKRAEKHGIPAYFIGSSGKTRQAHEKEIHSVLKKHRVKLVVLAGYMRLVTSYLISKYKHRILNIHPALLPCFPGTSGYEDAWQYGVKVSGCTIHFVDEGCDTGPIIFQAANPVREDDTFETFKKRGLRIEHKAYPEAIRLFCEGRLKVKGRKVIVSSSP